MVTNRCNRNCIFCFDENKKYGKDITISNLIKILDKAKSSGISEVCILGGEPTVHPNIVEICKICKNDYGMKTIMTTNYSKPYVVKECAQYLDSINISWYDQEDLPDPSEYRCDISLSALIYKNRLDNKRDLDAFIDKYGKIYNLRLATVQPTPRFPKSLCDVSQFLDTLTFDKKITLFGQIEGDIYRGVLIKRHDIELKKFEQPFSYNGHVNGAYDRSWNDHYDTEERGIEIFSSPILNIRKYVEFDPIANKSHNIYVIDDQDYVTAIVYNKTIDKYILCKQYRYGIDKYSIELVGGGKYRDESPKCAIIRELQEEAGYKIDKNYAAQDIKLLDVSYSNTGNTSSKIFSFYIEVSGIPEKQFLETFEHIEILECSKDDMNSIFEKQYVGIPYKVAWLKFKHKELT